MAETIQSQERGTATVEEFCDYVRAHVRPDSHDSMREAAHALKALSNNREFFPKVINSWLEDYSDDLSVPMGDTSFVLAKWDRFVVRANFWMPSFLLPDSVKMTSGQYGYLKPHDHPFNFLTVGYMGPGYTTLIYDNESAAERAAAADPAQLRLMETTMLPEGKLMLYRAYKDVHAQLAPETLSISLNLLVLPTSDTEQHIFNTDHGAVDKVIGSVSNPQALCQLALALGSSTSVPGLERLASRHKAPEIRRTALHSLYQLVGEEARHACEQAVTDPSQAVRESADRLLADICS
jgi:hypothetical protein